MILVPVTDSLASIPCDGDLHKHNLPDNYIGAAEEAELRLASGWQNVQCPFCSAWGWIPPVDADRELTEIDNIKALDFLDFKSYQLRATATAIYPGQHGLVGKLYCALGLTNEAGEVAGKIKKVIRDNASQFTDDKIIEIVDELGDVLWYLTQLATELDTSLESIAADNLAKLASRAKRGTIGGSGDSR
jgi:NTP pyrophosphatase (non-canonical NTP hydrolase)